MEHSPSVASAAEALATFPSKLHIFRKRDRKVIISEDK